MTLAPGSKHGLCRSHDSKMVLAIAQLKVPLLQFYDMSHAWTLIDLLEEFLHNVITALGLALDL